MRGRLVSSTRIDVSHVDQPIDYVFANIFGDNATSTRAVIIEATYIALRARRAQERPGNGPLGAPHQFLLMVAKKDDATGCQNNCGDEQQELNR
ncbi:MAG: hypothetical protein WBD95_06350, partial [Xanthobacteraceae bacterium]